MAAKNKRIVLQEMRSLLPYFAAVNAVYFAVLFVLFFATGFDYTLITGGLFGNAVCVLNFYILGVTAEIALRKSAKSAQTYMNLMYCVRYLGMFFMMSAAALLSCLNLFAAIVPLLFPKPVIMLRALRERNND
ncbi:MAG: hypothetical protein ACI4KA_07675 [Oscillospiraceae bacterium]